MWGDDVLRQIWARSWSRVSDLARATRRPHGWGLLVPVSFALAGVLFATSAEISRGTDLRASGNQSLPDLIRAEQRRLEASTARVEALRRSVEALTVPAALGDKRVALLNRQSAALALAAGTQAVRGPGVK